MALLFLLRPPVNSDVTQKIIMIKKIPPIGIIAAFLFNGVLIVFAIQKLIMLNTYNQFWSNEAMSSVRSGYSIIHLVIGIILPFSNIVALCFRHRWGQVMTASICVIMLIVPIGITIIMKSYCLTWSEVVEKYLLTSSTLAQLAIATAMLCYFC